MRINLGERVFDLILSDASREKKKNACLLARVGKWIIIGEMQLVSCSTNEESTSTSTLLCDVNATRPSREKEYPARKCLGEACRRTSTWTLIYTLSNYHWIVNASVDSLILTVRQRVVSRPIESCLRVPTEVRRDVPRFKILRKSWRERSGMSCLIIFKILWHRAVDRIDDSLEESPNCVPSYLKRCDPQSNARYLHGLNSALDVTTTFFDKLKF